MNGLYKYKDGKRIKALKLNRKINNLITIK